MRYNIVAVLFLNLVGWIYACRTGIEVTDFNNSYDVRLAELSGVSSNWY